MIKVNNIIATRNFHPRSIVQITGGNDVPGFQGFPVQETMAVQSGQGKQPEVEIGTSCDVDVALCEDSPYLKHSSRPAKHSDWK